MNKSRIDGPLLLRSLTIRNLLSFGPNTPPLALESLNVLIGPNGSGKSNLFEALALLRNSPTDLRPGLNRGSGGGAGDWIWKGAPDLPAIIEASVAKERGRLSLHHRISFRQEGHIFRLDEEQILNGARKIYQYRNGRGSITVRRKRMKVARLDPDLSILAQRRDPDRYPEVTHLASKYERIQHYREWSAGRKTAVRRPTSANGRRDRLEENFSNLGIFLSRLRENSTTKRKLTDGLRDLYEGLIDFELSVVGGEIQIFFREGDFNIPAIRLSDGSLHYLCLLALLCDPTPPPLICIEEPELGLHPDLMPKIADLLIDASTRTQLIVTTHSDILIDALSEHPNAVIVCEKQDGKTSLRRLNPTELEEWLKTYRLGQLWNRGQLGGNRW